MNRCSRTASLSFVHSNHVGAVPLSLLGLYGFQESESPGDDSFPHFEESELESLLFIREQCRSRKGNLCNGYGRKVQNLVPTTTTQYLTSWILTSQILGSRILTSQILDSWISTSWSLNCPDFYPRILVSQILTSQILTSQIFASQILASQILTSSEDPRDAKGVPRNTVRTLRYYRLWHGICHICTKTPATVVA